MEMLTTEEVRAFVSAFVAQHRITLTENQYAALVTASEKSWNQQNRLFAPLLHEMIFADVEGAGVLRVQQLINSRQEERAYPRSDIVPRLMEQVFRPTYQQVYDRDLTEPDLSIEEACWRVGALLRSIHPFLVGNRVVSFVIENQLRHRHGLRVATQLGSKDIFDRYRQNQFWPYAKKLMR